MIEQTLLDYLPLWAFGLVILTVVLVAGECGYRLGRMRARRPDSEKEGHVSDVVGAVLNLSAFMLAFTFGLAASRYEDRRELLQEELNAVGTTHLRAGLLPGDSGAKVRDYLREYVEIRLEEVQPDVDIRNLVIRSEELHNQLWKEAENASRHPERDSEFVSLFTESLNELIDLHSKRVTFGIRARIPPPVWTVLILLSIAGIGVIGYHAGFTKSSRSPAALGLIACFVLVMFLIAELDRPLERTLRITRQGFADLHDSMKDDVR